MAEFNFVYGTMGGGKTNYVVNKILAETKYKRVITNIEILPLAGCALQNLHKKSWFNSSWDGALKQNSLTE